MVYQFSDTTRETLEKQKMALAVYHLIDGKAVTVLVSDGVCKMQEDTRREHLISALNQSMFERVDPRDAGMLAQRGKEFILHERPYDVVYRCSDENGTIKPVHTVGFWQTMPDGTKLAFLYYTDLTKSNRQIKESTKQYFDKKKIIFTRIL